MILTEKLQFKAAHIAHIARFRRNRAIYHLRRFRARNELCGRIGGHYPLNYCRLKMITVLMRQNNPDNIREFRQFFLKFHWVNQQGLPSFSIAIPECSYFVIFIPKV